MRTTRVAAGHYEAAGGRFVIRSHYNRTGTTWTVTDTTGAAVFSVGGMDMRSIAVCGTKAAAVDRAEGVVEREADAAIAAATQRAHPCDDGDRGPCEGPVFVFPTMDLCRAHAKQREVY